MTLTIRCQGHAAITASHTKTFELTPDHDIGPRATCVIGVGAQVDGALPQGPVRITLTAAGRTHVVHAEANSFAAHGYVVRKSDFRGHDTFAVNADTAASDLDRALVQALQQGAELTATVEPAGDAPAIAVFTDDSTPQAAHEADEVVAATPLAQLRACAALAAPGQRALLLLDALPKQATERRALIAAALATAPVVVWRGPAKQAQPLLDLDGAVAAVDRGEVVTRIGSVPERIPADATVTVAVPGSPAPDDLGPVLKALREEGVTARTIRQALARLPHLAGSWDYDAINRL